MTIGAVVPTVSVTSSVNPSVYYQSVTLNALITPPSTGSPAPTGTVTFFNNGSLLGSAAAQANGGFSTATLVLPSTGVAALPVGPNNIITANYAGDQVYSQATSPTTAQGGALVQVVNRAGTTVSVTSDCAACVSTQPITLTATVVVVAPGGNGTTAATQPSGQVTFYASNTGATPVVIGPPAGVALKTTQSQNQPTVYTAALQITAAQLAAQNLVLGQLNVIAYYSGDGNYNNNTSPVYQVPLNKATVSLALSSSQNPAIVGTAVTFTAVVTPLPPGTGIPTGQVQFFDGNQNLNGLPASTTGVVLANGTASFT